ncbi:MAG: class I SAM-dependent methyltransferase [Candidatus Sumerlaeota bacterium]|nr:class I SAM-dependent methyltransferase [Candidatus Sumerlaeota bacterium]
MSQNTDAYEKWTKTYRAFLKNRKTLNWPPTPLVRMFMGNYIPNHVRDFAGKKVLDVGCGTGNNMGFFGMLGLELYGTEVSDELCDLTRKMVADLGLSLDIRTGFNRQIPFLSDFFDYLVSWNVIHYENNEKDMIEAIAEYARVLKPGGRMFLSTTGPKHMILKNAEIVGPHLYKVGREDDFRKGEVFFYFDSPEYIKYYFSKSFKDVMVGTVSDFMFTEWQDYFLVTAVK